MCLNGFFGSVVVGSRSELFVVVDSSADIVGPHGYSAKVGTTLMESWKAHCSGNNTERESVEGRLPLVDPTVTRRDRNGRYKLRRALCSIQIRSPRAGKTESQSW